ncbi:MAG: PAS domain S-box protein [Desulfobacteraceae bacterium]|nr:PAS domain S-box protein [Desulfobacteraceae bacterium]
MTLHDPESLANAWSRLKDYLRKGAGAVRLGFENINFLHQMLEENKVLFNAMVDAFEAKIYICSSNYRIEYLNERMIRHLGYDATGEFCYEAFGRQSVCPWCINNRILKGETVKREFISPKDKHWYYVVNAPIRHADGSTSKYAMMMDIHHRKLNEHELKKHRTHLEELVKARTAELTFTNAQLRLEIEERKEAEDALRRSEAKYRELVENANSMIIRFDTQGRLTFFNEYAQKFFGCSESEILGRNILDTILSEVDTNMENTREKMENFLASPEKYENTILENISTNGDRAWVAWTNRPIRDKNDYIVEFLCVGVDITERKQARQKIQNLTHELLKAQENERYKISRDLHDHIAQDLSSLKIGLQTLFENDEPVRTSHRKRVDNLVQVLQRSITEVRNIAYGLRPPGLDQLGLASTLFIYCEDFGKNNDLKIDFMAAGLDDLVLDEDTQINIYRLTQEALHNVNKHSKAKKVVIRLVASSPHLMLRIIDDGEGFDVKHWRSGPNMDKKMGLSSMEERVGLLDGLIDIRSRPGKGTAIFITIPTKDLHRDSKKENFNHRRSSIVS